MIIQDFYLFYLLFFFFFLLTLFYLDDFKLSKNIYIRFIQILYPILFILILCTIVYQDDSRFNVVCFALEDNKPGNTVNIGGNVELTQESAESLGRNIGFAGTVGGIAGGVGKAISKSSIPPLQKASIVVASGAAAAGIFLAGSNLNRGLNSNTSSSSSSSSANSLSSTKPDIVSKLIDDSGSISNNSELMNVILGLNMITYACLSLIIILFMMILFKFFLNEDKIKLNLSGLIGDKLNKSLNYYFIKIIQLNKKTSTVYILIIFIVLFISLAFEGYFITLLYNNLDKFIDLHINRRS